MIPFTALPLPCPARQKQQRERIPTRSRVTHNSCVVKQGGQVRSARGTRPDVTRPFLVHPEARLPNTPLPTWVVPAHLLSAISSLMGRSITSKQREGTLAGVPFFREETQITCFMRSEERRVGKECRN